MRRGDAAVVVLVYVVPLGAATVLLTVAGLGGVALALLVVELGVSAAVVLARRTRPGPLPAPGRAGPATRPWLVPLVMVALLLAIVGIAVLASRIG